MWQQSGTGGNESGRNVLDCLGLRGDWEKKRRQKKLPILQQRRGSPKKNNLGPREPGFLMQGDSTRRRTALPASPCSASSGTLLRTCLGSALGTYPDPGPGRTQCVPR